MNFNDIDQVDFREYNGTHCKVRDVAFTPDGRSACYREWRDAIIRYDRDFALPNGTWTQAYLAYSYDPKMKRHRASRQWYIPHFGQIWLPQYPEPKSSPEEIVSRIVRASTLFIPLQCELYLKGELIKAKVWFKGVISLRPTRMFDEYYVDLLTGPLAGRCIQTDATDLFGSCANEKYLRADGAIVYKEGLSCRVIDEDWME